MNLFQRFLVLLVKGYQRVISPLFVLLGVQCRFHPSCSAYAIGAIEKDGAVRGTYRALRRLLRCHPWHPGGIDPP